MGNNLRRDEAGYSMVEVLVAMLILAIAIIPMFKMFDVGLRTTTTSSNYDLAQSLAEKQAELVQANPYDTVKASFPNASPFTPGITCSGSSSGDMTASGGQTISGCEDSDSIYDNKFSFSVNKRYVKLPTSGGALVAPSTDEGLLQVTIKVTSVGSDTVIFETSGVIAK